MSKPTWVYTVITYLITWGVCVPAYLLYRDGVFSLEELNLIYNFGALGPFIGAVVCAGIFYGSVGIKQLFSSLSIRKLTRPSLVIAFSPLLFLAIGVLLYPLFAGHWYTFADTKKQFGLTDTIS